MSDLFIFCWDLRGKLTLSLYDEKLFNQTIKEGQ